MNTHDRVTVQLAVSCEAFAHMSPDWLQGLPGPPWVPGQSYLGIFGYGVIFWLWSYFSSLSFVMFWTSIFAMQCIFDQFLSRACEEILLKGQISVRWSTIFFHTLCASVCSFLNFFFWGGVLCLLLFLIIKKKKTDEIVKADRAGVNRSYDSGLQVLWVDMGVEVSYN